MVNGAPGPLARSRRTPLGWAVSALVTAACWWALLSGALGGGTGGGIAGVGLMFAGGWSLSLLPVHSTLLRRPRSVPAVGTAAGEAVTEAAVTAAGGGRAGWGGIRRLRGRG